MVFTGNTVSIRFNGWNYGITGDEVDDYVGFCSFSRHVKNKCLAYKKENNIFDNNLGMKLNEYSGDPIPLLIPLKSGEQRITDQFNMQNKI